MFESPNHTSKLKEEEDKNKFYRRRRRRSHPFKYSFKFSYFYFFFRSFILISFLSICAFKILQFLNMAGLSCLLRIQLYNKFQLTELSALHYLPAHGLFFNFNHCESPFSQLKS